MGVVHGPLRRRHSGKGRAVPERPPVDPYSLLRLATQNDVCHWSTAAGFWLRRGNWEAPAITAPFRARSADLFLRSSTSVPARRRSHTRLYPHELPPPYVGSASV